MANWKSMKRPQSREAAVIIAPEAPPPPPPPASRLAAALMDGDRTGDKRLFYEVFLESKLLVPLRREPSSSLNPRLSDLNYLIRVCEGWPSLLGFSDVEALDEFFPAPRKVVCATLDARDLCRIAIGQEVDQLLINAAGPVGFSLSPLECQLLAAGVIPEEGMGARR